MIAITGNTYPVREQLKALGAKWEPRIKAWMVSPENVEKAKAIVNGAPAPTPRTYTAARVSTYKGRRPCGYPGCRGQGDPLCDDCGE